jgi:hypothetical protein
MLMETPYIEHDSSPTEQIQETTPEEVIYSYQQYNIEESSSHNRRKRNKNKKNEAKKNKGKNGT